MGGRKSSDIIYVRSLRWSRLLFRLELVVTFVSTYSLSRSKGYINTYWQNNEVLHLYLRLLHLDDLVNWYFNTRIAPRYRYVALFRAGGIKRAGVISNKRPYINDCPPIFQTFHRLCSCIGRMSFQSFAGDQYGRKQVVTFENMFLYRNVTLLLSTKLSKLQKVLGR